VAIWVAIFQLIGVTAQLFFHRNDQVQANNELERWRLAVGPEFLQLKRSREAIELYFTSPRERFNASQPASPPPQRDPLPYA
jgi:hypothetical protein